MSDYYSKPLMCYYTVSIVIDDQKYNIHKVQAYSPCEAILKVATRFHLTLRALNDVRVVKTKEV